MGDYFGLASIFVVGILTVFSIGLSLAFGLALIVFLLWCTWLFGLCGYGLVDLLCV